MSQQDLTSSNLWLSHRGMHLAAIGKQQKGQILLTFSLFHAFADSLGALLGMFSDKDATCFRTWCFAGAPWHDVVHRQQQFISGRNRQEHVRDPRFNELSYSGRDVRKGSTIQKAATLQKSE